MNPYGGDMTSPELRTAFALLVIFQLKQFIADFPLQREYMLRKVRPGWDFFLPLAMHSGVHAVFTLIIALAFKPNLWWLAVVDFIVHFIMDRLKSGPKYLGRFHDLNRSSFWNVLGFDQMVHHLTHLYIVWILITHV
jgi:hypothetical protein